MDDNNRPRRSGDTRQNGSELPLRQDLPSLQGVPADSNQNAEIDQRQSLERPDSPNLPADRLQSVRVQIVPNPLSPEQNQDVLLTQPARSPVPQKPKSKKWLMWLIGGISLLAVVAVLVLVLVLKNQSHGDVNDNATSQNDGTAIDVSSDVQTNIATAYDRLAKRGVGELTARDKTTVVDKVIALLAQGGYSVTPDFFKDDARAMALIGLAYRALHEDSSDEFNKHALYLLTENYLTNKVDVPDRYASDKTNAQIQDAYAEYTDNVLTAKIRKYVTDSGVLDETRTRLKLGVGESVQPEILVLDVVNGEPSASAFQAAVGEPNSWLPVMWTSKIGDKTFMAYTKDYAQQILASPENETSKAYIRHEYVHTQPGMTPNIAGYLGVITEERRAEHFSGDKGAYFDVKQFIIYLKVITGYDLLADLDKNPRDEALVYANMAKKIGLIGATEVIFSFPQQYLEAPNESMEAVSTFLGSRDGVLKRLMAREVTSGNESAMNERFKAQITSLKSKVSASYLSGQYLDDMTNAYYLPTIRIKLEEYLK